MRFEIETYEGAGPVRFGMTREQVRAGLRSDVTPFRKAADDEELSDQFPALGVVVFYEPPGRCCAVEFNGTEPEPSIDGHALLGLPAAEVGDWLRERDPDLRSLLRVLISPRLGIAVPASGDDDRGRPVETVLAFRRGYYDDPPAA